MSRALWFAAGAGAGLWSTFKARRLAYRLTPDGIHDQLASVATGWRAFAGEVRCGMAEREAEIAGDLALGPRVPTGPRALAAAAADHQHPDTLR